MKAEIKSMNQRHLQNRLDSLEDLRLRKFSKRSARGMTKEQFYQKFAIGLSAFNFSNCVYMMPFVKKLKEIETDDEAEKEVLREVTSVYRIILRIQKEMRS